MADRDYEKLTITCPKCTHMGVADGFNVDKFPPDFSLAKDGGGHQRKTEVLCKCGNTFKL